MGARVCICIYEVLPGQRGVLPWFSSGWIYNIPFEIYAPDADIGRLALEPRLFRSLLHALLMPGVMGARGGLSKSLGRG